MNIRDFLTSLKSSEFMKKQGFALVFGLILSPNIAKGQNYSDPLTAPSPAYLSVAQTTPNLYSYDYSNNGLHFQKIGAMTGSIQDIEDSLNLGAINAANASDFDAKVDFTGAQVGPGVDQVELHAKFADGSIFFGVYDVESGFQNVHVYDGGLHNETAVSGNSGTLELSRTNGATSFLYSGTPIFTENNTSPLAGISFVLQNNLGSNDTTAVTYHNFSFSSTPAPSSLVTVLIGIVPGVMLLRRRRK